MRKPLSRYSADDERNDNSGRAWVTAPTAEAVGLLPCPICGKAAQRNGRGRSGGVVCAQRTHRLQVYGSSQIEAEEVWNRRALSAVPDDGLGSSSPKSEDTQSGAEGAVLADYPDADGTDAAHPAWWRGHEHTAAVFCQKVNEILDGQDDGRGVSNEPWETTRRRLLQAAPSPSVPTGDAEGAVVGWPEKWSGDCTVGNFIANLSTLPPEMPLYAAYHIPLDEGSMLKVKRPTLSRERVVGTNIKNGDESVPYSAVIWTQPRDQYGHAPATPAGSE